MAFFLELESTITKVDESFVLKFNLSLYSEKQELQRSKSMIAKWGADLTAFSSSGFVFLGFPRQDSNKSIKANEILFRTEYIIYYFIFI